MLMYSHSCVADILFTMYVRFKETIGTGYKTEMHFRPKNSYWSTCVFLFAGTVFCICQNVTCSMILLTLALKQFGGITRHNAAAHVLAYTVHMALHIYVAVCLSFLRLRSGCLNEDGSILV